MQRHRALDLVRGLAALGVALYHWLAWNGGIEVPSLGTFGVYLFFVLSALTIAMVYSPVFGEAVTIQPLASFFRSRIVRLLPLLALVSATGFVLSRLLGEPTMSAAGKAVLTGSGFFWLALPGFLSNTTGSWSLGIELAFYAVGPVAVLAVVRGKLGAIVWAVAALLAAQQIYLLLIAPMPDPRAHWDYYAVPLTFAPFFALGLLIFKVGGTRSPVFLAPMLGGFLCVAVFSLVWPVDLFRSPGSYLALTFVCGATIYCAYRTELPRALRRPAEFLGDISYALYLTHPLTNMVLLRIAKGFGLPPDRTLLIFLPVAVVVADSIFRFFERPLRDKLRKGAPKPLVATVS